MRKLITHLIKALPLLALLFSVTLVDAQRLRGPLVLQDYETAVRNVVQSTTNPLRLEFEIYLKDTDPTEPFILAGYQAGIYINPGIFPPGAVITATIVGGTSQLKDAQIPNAIEYDPAVNEIKLAGRTPPGPGDPGDPDGTVISTAGNGTRVCKIRVTSTLPYVTNSMPNLAFYSSDVLVPLYATRVAHYDETNATQIWDEDLGIFVWETPPLNVQLAVIPGAVGDPGTNAHVYNNPILNPGATCADPAVQAVTGAGAYCQGTGGLEVGLSGSQSGVNYTLNPGNVLVPGTGAAITFGFQLAGDYTITGTGTGVDPAICTTTITMGTVLVTETPTPVAIITPNGPLTFCAGGSVDLVASAGDSYLWSNGATTPSITVNASGTFTVTVTLNGCSATSSITEVIVTPLPVATITASGPTTFCTGGSVELTASTGDSYLWSNGDTSPTIPVNTSGIYTVTVTTNGCSDISDPVEVVVNPYPVAVITPSGPTTFCAGGSVDLTASAGDSYLWSNSETTQTITVNASGTFSVAVTTNGCTDVSDMVEVVVNPLLTPTVSVVANPAGAVVTGTPVEFTAYPVNGGAAPTYEWFVNGASVSTTNPFTYVPVNEDVVYVMMTSNAGCLTVSFAVSDLITMVVNDVILPPTAFNVTGSGSYCAGSGGLLVVLDGSELGVTYTMMPGSIVVPGTGAPIDFGYQLAGTYTVSGANSAGTVDMNGSAVIVEIAVPLPSVSIVVDNNNICGEASVTFTATPIDGGTAPYYEWFKNGVSVATGSNTYTYGPAADLDDVYVTMLSDLACAGTTPVLSDHIIMSVTTPVTPMVSIVVSTNTIVAGTPVTFTATPVYGGVPVYAWFVNGLPAGTNNFEFTYAPANGDMVQVEMTSSLNCVTSATAMSNVIDMVVLPASCPETTWTGLVNNDWFNDGNWNPCVPQEMTNVIIPAGCPNYPTIIMPPTNAVICLATINNLTIADGASLIGQQYLCVLNDAVAERTILNSNFHLISSPVDATTFGDVFLPAYWFEVWAREYDEPSGDWVNRFIGDNLNVGQGYSVQMTTAPQTATFTGMLNSGDVTRTLSNMNPGTDLNRVGWNLLGNPFPSAIDWDVFSTGDYDAQVAVWDQAGAGNYIYWNGTLGSLTDGLIPAQNGFFVKTATDGAALTIPLAAQVHFVRDLYKSNVANALELRADGNNYYDATFVHFNSNATAAFDSQYDAFKLDGLETAPQFYSLSAGYNLSINELPFEGNEVVDLGFNCGVAGTYSITASGMESFSSSTPILLEDLKLNTIQDLRLSPVYSFSYATGDNNNRFKLHFKNATGIDNPVNSGITVYSFDHTVVINNTTGLAGEVRIFDLTGRELKDAGMNSSTITRIPMQASIGTYIVKVTTAQGSVNQKVFIK